ncbi:hypothetical protein N0V86_002911 [Didymella sp. IMI 355093]|nr:hypothetical protein N0V86_002911 [Didymella sp. IMI 355093]
MSLREEPRQIPTEPPTQILLLGAGELGLALLSHITTLPNISITLGIRSASKHTHLASPTTSLLELDLSSPSPTLVPKFSEYDVVISATGYTSSPNSVLKLANEDIGRCLTRILRGDVEAVNSVLYVAGDTVTYRDLAATVERVSMRQVVREVWDEEHLRRELQQDPEDGIKKYRLAFAREGVRWEKERTINWKLGVDVMDVETYAMKLFAVKK